MKISIMAAIAAAAALGAGAATAQEIDWNSELNRTWWNGVTGAELRELTLESGGVWTDLPDMDDVRVGRIDWPDLKGVMVREVDCPAPERPMDQRNCATMLLSVAVNEPDDIENWWLDNNGWLAFGRVDDAPALYRLEHHAFGTTRGRVLSELMLFRARAIAEIERIEASQGSGW